MIDPNDKTLFPDLKNRPKQVLGSRPMLHSAISYAQLWHHGQERRFPPHLPYIVHPIAVMQIVSEFTDDEDMLAAAVLHDVVEDTLVEIEVIGELFNTRVMQLVYELTKPFDISKACGDAQTIKCADIADNCKDVMEKSENGRDYVKSKYNQLQAMTCSDDNMWNGIVFELEELLNE